MKILHTADWHIGKVLHKYALRDELRLFFEWLIELIEKEFVELLLVSGDIFDLANPAVKDRELYYRFLSLLIKLDIKVVITGGNHDAIGVLNAPQKILDALNITVIGGATDNIEDELIEVKNKANQTALIIAAVPFLRDKDLRSQESDEKYENRTEAIREGIKTHYAQLAEICENKYGDLPVIAMGHLYAKGASTSESEREIHIGNAAAVESSIFSSTFNYVALGHIHRPQVIGKNEHMRYSGSPIALSFSEKSDKKSLVILNLKDGKIGAPKIVNVPKFRALQKFSGDLQHVKERLSEFKPQFPLTSFVEIEVIEETYSASILAEVDELVSLYSESTSFTILKPRTTFTENEKDTAALFEEGQHIEDLKPIDVFTKLMDHQLIEIEQQAILKEAFNELLESANQTDAS
ncbi:MAG: exonuclease SbcD [Saprospiraceae bacterium]